MKFTLGMILEARERLKGVAQRTGLVQFKALSDEHSQIYLKTEDLQNTGSFKVRGAYIKIASLSEEERAWMGDDAARFAQLWTAKEAMLKCRGAALGRLRHLPLAMTPDGPAAQQGALRLFFPPAPGGYALALCMEE